MASDIGKPLTGLRKAAILMAVLGSRRAGEMISRCALDQPELERLAVEMARLSEVDQPTREAVAREFTQLVGSPGSSTGGPRFAEEVLTQVVGQAAASDMVRRAGRRRGARPFASFADLSAKQLLDILRDESPQATAVVLRYLPRKQAGEVLSGLPEETRPEVVMGLLKGGEPCPEALQRMEGALAQRAASLGGWEAAERAETTGGPRTLVEVLNQADIAVETSVLESLAQRDPELAAQVRESMFIFEDLPRLDPRAIQTVLREVEPADLAMAMKGASEAIKKIVSENLSENAAAGLREDLESLGPVRKRDVHAGQQKVVMVVRARLSEGKISLRQEEEAEEMIA